MRKKINHCVFLIVIAAVLSAGLSVLLHPALAEDDTSKDADVEEIRRQASDLRDAANYDGAIEKYQSALKQLSSHPKRSSQVKSELELTYKEKAFHDLLEAGDNPTLAGQAALNLAKSYEAARKRDRAIVMLEKYVRRFPGPECLPKAILELAYCYDYEGYYNSAEMVCERLIRQHTDEPDSCASAWLRIAYSREHAGDLDEASVAFQKVINGYGENTRKAAIAKGDMAFTILARDGKLPEAIGLTGDAIVELEPGDPARSTLRWRLGNYYERLGDYQQALDHYFQVGEDRGSDPCTDLRVYAPLGIARCLVALNDRETACVILERAIEKYPALADAIGLVTFFGEG